MFAATSSSSSLSSSGDRLPPRSVSSSAISSLLSSTSNEQQQDAASSSSPSSSTPTPTPNPPLRTSILSILTRRQSNYGTTASTSPTNSTPSSPSTNERTPTTTTTTSSTSSLLKLLPTTRTSSSSAASTTTMTTTAATATTASTSSPSPSPDSFRTGSSAPEKNTTNEGSSPDWTKTHRRRRSESLNLGGAFRAVREGAIFERFMLIGLSPQTEPLHFSSDKTEAAAAAAAAVGEDLPQLSPSVLFYYPTGFTESLTKLLKSQIAQFCFPEGITPLCTIHYDSQGTMSPPTRRALFTPLSDLEKAENSFVFLLNTGECVLYGMCVLHNEAVKTSPSFMSKKSRSAPKEEDCNFIAPRCYCIISRFPYFSTHFSVLYSVLARERLYSLTSSKDGSGDSENEVIRILDEYYAKNVSNFTQTLNFKLCEGLNSLDYYFPTAVEDTLIADWCFPCLFRAVSLPNIMSLFKHALLENRIVIKCQNLGVLSAIVMSIMPLLRPFVWQGPFIPILPTHLTECLQAPVPTIVGLRSAPEDYEPNTFVLDVDKDSIIQSSDDQPPLPDYQFIYELLNQYSELLHSPENRYHDPYKTSPETKRIARLIVEQFSVYNSRLLDRISSNISTATDLTDSQQLKDLVNKFHPDERDFMWLLLNTQQFSIHSERLLHSAVQRKKAKEVILSKLDDLVIQEQQAIEAAEEMIRLQQQRIVEARDAIVALKTTQTKLSISGFTPSIIECHPFSSTKPVVALDKSG